MTLSDADIRRLAELLISELVARGAARYDWHGIAFGMGPALARTGAGLCSLVVRIRQRQQADSGCESPGDRIQGRLDN